MKILFKKPLQLFAFGVSLSLMTTTARSETLADALVSAYNHSGLLEQNRALLRAADEDVASASAALLPIINWLAKTDRTYSNSNILEGSEASFSVNAELLLYDFGGSKASVAAARESVFATRSELLSTEQQIMLRAVTAYFEVHSASKFVTLRQNNLRLLTQELRAAKDRFDVGEVTRTDVALAEARLAEARSGLATAEGDLLTAQAEYANVIGHQPRNLAQLPRLPRISGNVVSAQSQAVRNHPDMIATQHKLASLEYTLESTQAAFQPKIKTTGSLFLKNDLL